MQTGAATGAGDGDGDGNSDESPSWLSGNSFVTTGAGLVAAGGLTTTAVSGTGEAMLRDSMASLRASNCVDSTSHPFGGSGSDGGCGVWMFCRMLACWDLSQPCVSKYR